MDLNSSIQKALDLINEKKFEEALNILNEFKQQDHRILFLKGTIYLSQKKIDLAEQNLISASKLNNQNYSIFHNLGIIYGIKGNNQSALENFVKAANINGHLESLSEIGQIYLNQNNFVQAKKHFEEALKKDNNHKRTNMRIGNMYLKMNEHKKGWSYIYKATGLIRFSENGMEIV